MGGNKVLNESNLSLAPQVSEIPGVGYKMSRVLNELGIKTCSELLKFDRWRLEKEIGSKTSSTLRQ